MCVCFQTCSHTETVCFNSTTDLLTSKVNCFFCPGCQKWLTRIWRKWGEGTFQPKQTCSKLRSVLRPESFYTDIELISYILYINIYTHIYMCVFYFILIILKADCIFPQIMSDLVFESNERGTVGPGKRVWTLYRSLWTPALFVQNWCWLLSKQAEASLRLQISLAVFY